MKFFEWAFENGWSKGLEIDRIDNNKGYEPENCRWTTRVVNLYNRGCTKWIEYNGITRSFKEWAEILGVNKNLIRDRLKAGKSVEYALFEPKHRNKYI